ncbi:flavin monoamine oxidase family protein [Flavobacterium sandaracinum]|uniref:Amine oxidase n=1 Tax=Flavobacterium sandaracinum TaxID=2541733 RepID=A0A4R5CMV9_9FLAO|nr:NAD(P)/FAD-dependent oxidoreductase [Flavobacterium sandaracinum]TDE01346.1 amine oxidase [Flavobacterium sandaracinum]
MKKEKVVVIGAGLCGLYTAFLLQKKGIEVLILEGNTRIGGRIKTITGTTAVTMEMGATWFGNQHQHLLEVLHTLELPYFRQHTKGISLFETMSFVPPQKFEISDSEEPSFRIEGGTAALIDKLSIEIGIQNIKTSTKITAIKEENNQLILVDSNGNSYSADKVISTIPPNLLVNSVVFEPNLTENFTQLAKKTHTWMGESIKFAVEYKTPFWKQNNYSGTLFSQASIVQEMYDHSTADNSGFALKGFLNGGTAVLSLEERKEKVIAQLTTFFGSEATNYVGYYENVWRQEPLTFQPYEQLVLAHQNNGHSIFKTPFLNEKLYVSGAETATQNPGYMDGAIFAAKTIASQF